MAWQSKDCARACIYKSRSHKINETNTNKQTAENRIQKEQKLNMQHRKQDIMSQFLTVRAQRAHLLLRVYCERSEQ